MSNWPEADLDLLDSIYQLKCRSRMNSIYYELRLTTVQLFSFWMETAIAATASGSGLAAIVSKSTGTLGNIGNLIWPIVAILAAIAAIIRPIYAPGKKIEAFTRQHQGYHLNYFALEKLAFAIRQEGKVTSEHRRRYDSCYDRYVQLSTDAKAADDEVAPKNKIRGEAEARTRLELPPETFWWPDQRRGKPLIQLPPEAI